jgi:hypothetical protein
VTVVVLLALMQTGCLAVGLALFSVGAGVGAGTAVNYSLNGYAYRTFTSPLTTVEHATTRTMRNMGFQLQAPEQIKEGRVLHATGNERTIEVRLEKVSDKTTRMRTMVSQGTFLKDRATATEIILQTEQALAHS